MTPEQICPPTVGQAVFALSLENPNAKLLAHQPIAILIVAVRAPEVVRLPLQITVSSGLSSDSYRRQVFRLVVPRRFVFFPVQGGPHVIRVAELYHQRYLGTLQLEVEGDRLESGTL